MNIYVPRWTLAAGLYRSTRSWDEGQAWVGLRSSRFGIGPLHLCNAQLVMVVPTDFANCLGILVFEVGLPLGDCILTRPIRHSDSKTGCVPRTLDAEKPFLLASQFNHALCHCSITMVAICAHGCENCRVVRRLWGFCESVHGFKKLLRKQVRCCDGHRLSGQKLCQRRSAVWFNGRISIMLGPCHRPAYRFHSMIAV